MQSSCQAIDEREFEQLSRYIEQHSGIAVPPEKTYLFETRLTGVMVSAGVKTFRELCAYLQTDKEPLIRKKIINSITTNETMWFRDRMPWKLLEEKLLPSLIDQLRSGKKSKLRIWFSAVSTGQEAYSTVMCIDDYLRRHKISDISLGDFDFVATDISNSVLEIAKHGKYDQISIMRGLDEYYKSRYFTRKDSVWELSGKIREAVDFREFNLLDSFGALGIFDVIFCRYVMIYFSEETNREIAKKLHGALASNGVLLNGNYVFYDLLTELFEMTHFDNYTYYLRKG